MISQTRRSAIPISTSGNRRLMARSLSRSRDTLLSDMHLSAAATDAVHSPPTGDGDDLRTFTLLEENIALKEQCELLCKLNDQQSRTQSAHIGQIGELRARCEHLQRTETETRAQAKRTAQQLQQRNEAAKAEADARLGAAKAQADGELTGVRAQLAGVELHLYELNEKCAELTEENGRLLAECTSATCVARLVCDAVARMGLSFDQDVLREVKAQHEIFARVAKTTTADGRALLAALQLMELRGTNGSAPPSPAINGAGAIGAQIALSPAVAATKPQPQQLPTANGAQQTNGGGQATTANDEVAAAGDVTTDAGRIVQLPKPNNTISPSSSLSIDTDALEMPPPLIMRPTVRPARPPPPPIPPRNYNTVLSSTSNGQRSTLAGESHNNAPMMVPSALTVAQPNMPRLPHPPQQQQQHYVQPYHLPPSTHQQPQSSSNGTHFNEIIPTAHSFGTAASPYGASNVAPLASAAALSYRFPVTTDMDAMRAEHQRRRVQVHVLNDQRPTTSDDTIFV